MATLHDLVERVRAIPYGRPSERTAEAVIVEQRGTCSTKHLLLRDLAWESGPEADLRLVHRVYRVTPGGAVGLFDDQVAAAVPEDGLVDVHTYATALIAGRRVVLDVTFPGSPPWDGCTDMPLACTEGVDVEAGDDPIASKDRPGRRALQRRSAGTVHRSPCGWAAGAPVTSGCCARGVVVTREPSKL